MAEQWLQESVNNLLRRYTGATLESLIAVLCPLLIPIGTLDKRCLQSAGPEPLPSIVYRGLGRREPGPFSKGVEPENSYPVALVWKPV